MERSGELRREGDQYADHEPDRHSDQDRVEVAEKPVAAGEQGEQVSPAHPGLLLHRLEHARLGDPDPCEKEQEAERAADEEGVAPIERMGDHISEDRSRNSDRGHQHRSVTADTGMQHLRNQRDAGPELTREADARHEPEERVGRQRRHQAVGDVGQRVHQDRAEHNLQAPLLVP